MRRKERKVDNGGVGVIDTVQLELEGFCPQDEDRDGIIQLLNQLFPKTSELHYGGLADYIISQDSVGTVVKNCPEFADSEDDDDIVFSVTSILPLTETAIAKCFVLGSLRDYLCSMVLKSENSASDIQKIMKIIENKDFAKCALLLNERFVNLPPSISALAVSALPEEIKSLEDENRPTHLLLLTRAMKQEDSDVLIYLQPEMELVRRSALVSVESKVNYCVEDGDPEVITYVLMIIEFSGLAGILDSLSEMP